MNEQQKKLVPKLRFPEFVKYEGWVVKPFQKLFTIGSGRDYKHLSNGSVPVYGSGGYMLSVDDFLYDGESVCIGRKGTINNPMFLTGKFWTVDTLFYTHSFQQCLPKFIYAIFQNIEWLKHNEAGGVPSLSKTIIEKIQTAVPETPEQQKIADCLSSLDELITAQVRKVEALKTHKKGLMQQLFPREGETQPLLRFPEFQNTENWKECRFDEVFDRLKRKNTSNEKNVLTISAQDGLVSQLNYFNKSISSKDISGYQLLTLGDFAYNKSYSHGYPWGAIKSLKKYDAGVVSPLYICFRLRNAVTNSGAFFEQYFDAGCLDIELEKIAQEGARNHGLLNIGILEFFDRIRLRIPHLEEQRRIASLLSSLDAHITSVIEELDTLKAHKKGLMQQLFPMAEAVVA